MSEEVLYNNITLSPTTKKKRQQVKTLQDDFMTFSWGGINAFESFGAFILNDKKGSLKFYNGPGFSNEYSKPQFDNAGGKIIGVSFNKQTISFSIGVYWISIKHYRLLIDWLNPLKTADLSFGHDPRYRYNVKLSKIGDSTRWVVGREGEEYMYYTELNLSFEVQGDQCAHGVNSYEWKNHQEFVSVDCKWNYNGSDDDVGVGSIAYAFDENNNNQEALYDYDAWSYYCDIPVSVGQTYQIETTDTDARFPFYLLLNTDKNQVIDFKKPNEYNYGVDNNIYIKYAGYLRVQTVGEMASCSIMKKEPEGWQVSSSSTANKKILTIPLCDEHDFIPSDLPTPFEVTIPLKIFEQDSMPSTSQQKYNILLELYAIGEKTQSIPLFSLDLKNLTHTSVSQPSAVLNLNLTYNSQNGLVYLKYGESSEKILTLLSLNDTGERIVDSFTSYKAKLPGEFNYPGFYKDNQVVLQLTITKSNPTQPQYNTIPHEFYDNLSEEAQIICFPRTNLI